MRRIAVLAAVLTLAAAGPALFAAGGTVTDQVATLTYPFNHWSNGLANLNRVGGSLNPLDSPILRSAWWYRVEGDSREHRLPVPDIETYAAGRISATWSNLSGSGISLHESTDVFDGEGPSGGFVTTMFAVNQGSAPRTLHLFHLEEVFLGDRLTGDSGVAPTPRVMILSDGPAARALYRAELSSHFQAGPSQSLLAALEDTSVTQLNDSGLPFGPIHFPDTAYQFGPIALPPCPTCGPSVVAAVSTFINPPQDHVQGDTLGVLGQSPLVLEVPGRSGALLQPMRRTQALSGFDDVAFFPGPTPASRPFGLADFDGDLVDEPAFRDTRSGATFVGARQITGAPLLPLNWKLSATGDFDHDGRADILWRNTVSQKLVVWTMNGAAKTGSLVPNPDQAANANWEVAGAADFSGDGNRDLLWYNQTTGKIVMWNLDASLQRTAGLFTTPNGVGSNAWRVVAVGDYGKGSTGVYGTQDIVWQNDVSRKIVVWHMDQNATRTSGVFTAPDTIGGGLPVAGPR